VGNWTLGVSEGDGFGVGAEFPALIEEFLLIAVPLLQINLLPLLMHLNSLPLKILATPFLLHMDPAFGAFAEKAGSADREKRSTKQITSLRFTV
jgi:hypothetical protein